MGPIMNLPKPTVVTLDDFWMETRGTIKQVYIVTATQGTKDGIAEDHVELDSGLRRIPGQVSTKALLHDPAWTYIGRRASTTLACERDVQCTLPRGHLG